MLLVFNKTQLNRVNDGTDWPFLPKGWETQDAVIVNSVNFIGVNPYYTWIFFAMIFNQSSKDLDTDEHNKYILEFMFLTEECHSTIAYSAQKPETLLKLAKITNNNLALRHIAWNKNATNDVLMNVVYRVQAGDRLLMEDIERHIDFDSLSNIDKHCFKYRKEISQYTL